MSDYWDPISTNCYPAEIALFTHGLTNTITDIYVYVLPMRLVWKTNLPKRKRIELVIIFGAGFLSVSNPRPSDATLLTFNRVCVSGGLRLYYTILTQKSDDSPWIGFAMYTWEATEVNLGIVCASAPPLKALIRHIIPNPTLSRTDSTARGERRSRARNLLRVRKEGYVLDKARTRRDTEWVGCES